MDVRRVTVRPRESIVHERSSVRLIPFHPGRLFRLPHVLKLPQLIISVLVLLMARFATGPHVFHKTSEGKGFYQRPREENPEIYAVDWEIVMTMVYFGTFAFQLMLVVGVIAGDVAPTVNGLFATYGTVFYLIAGIIGIVVYGSDAQYWQVHIVVGTLAIINSLLFLAEIVVSWLPKYSAVHH